MQMNVSTGKIKINGNELAEFFRQVRMERENAEDFIFVCIGTDRSTGDALGPLVGTYLREEGISQVLGTLELPCDASNLAEKIKGIPLSKTVIAIDACLGLSSSIGTYQVAQQPIAPGRSVGRLLPSVGNFSVAAIVNAEGVKPLWNLQNTSLHLVIGMAKEISQAIVQEFKCS